MIPLNKQKIEEKDISANKTDLVVEITRAKIFKYGKVITLNIACTINNVTQSNFTLFHTSIIPKYPMELYCSTGTRTYRCIWNTDGNINISGNATITGTTFVSITGTLIL